MKLKPRLDTFFNVFLGSCTGTWELKSRPGLLDLVGEDETARSLSHDSANTGSNIVFVVVVYLSVYFCWERRTPFFFLVQQYSTCAVSFGFPPLSPPSLPISPPVLPNITVTICVGHHVVILFRHSAYDGSWSVTADVAGSIGTINKYSVGQALLVKWTLCCSRKLFKCICVKSVRKHGFCNMPEGCNQFDPKKSQEFTLPVSRLKPQSLFNSFSTKVYSTLRPSQRRLFIPWLLFFPAVHHRSLTL